MYQAQTPKREQTVNRDVMNKALATASLVACVFVSAIHAADQAPAPNPAAQPSANTDASSTAVAQQQEKPSAITALLDSSESPGPVGLNEKLVVQLGTATSKPIGGLGAAKYVLFFNGKEVKGLPDPTYDNEHRSLVFELKRNDKNKDLWTTLLGAPSLANPTVRITVALGERPADANTAPQPTIIGSNGSDILSLTVFGPWRLGIAALLIAGVIWLVFARARKNTTLRDGFIPQMEPSQQTYSLARFQMAFWFVLIFCSFVFLYIATGDYNSISQQALVLMGISGATALAAVAVDVAKDSPADAINRGLQALGFNSYDDVKRTLEDEIPSRQAELQAKKQYLATLPQPPPGAPPARLTEHHHEWVTVDRRITQLTIEINDRRNRLSTYEARILPFKTQGFFKDVTTDINGTAIHRLQVFCWTLVLGGIFIIGVYRDLAMPEFGGTLLALMGISSAGYVGFKLPEENN
jgi:hypothetical protein